MVHALNSSLNSYGRLWELCDGEKQYHSTACVDLIELERRGGDWKCERCGSLVKGEVYLCPHCQHTKSDWVELKGRIVLRAPFPDGIWFLGLENGERQIEVHYGKCIDPRKYYEVLVAMRFDQFVVERFWIDQPMVLGSHEVAAVYCMAEVSCEIEFPVEFAP